MNPEETLSMTTPQDVRPWWREPWPWILMAGPAAALVGCIVTIVLAYTWHPDTPITEGAVRRGLVVEKAPDAAHPAAAVPAPRRP